MPKTALWRGLSNAFDPVEALRESASYLRELKITFGNLGLAAAAYNAGPGRLSRWLSGKNSLPQETVEYVRIVTGKPIEEWSSRNLSKWTGVTLPNEVPCSTLASSISSASSSHDRPSFELGALGRSAARKLDARRGIGRLREIAPKASCSPSRQRTADHCNLWALWHEQALPGAGRRKHTSGRRATLLQASSKKARPALPLVIRASRR